jgi:hypothetical protein
MSSPDILIRPAAPADLKVIGRLGALLVRTHHDFDPDRFLAATPGTEHAYGSFLGTQFDEPNIIILAAERGGEVVGYTYSGVEGNDYMTLRGPAPDPGPPSCRYFLVITGAQLVLGSAEACFGTDPSTQTEKDGK